MAEHFPRLPQKGPLVIPNANMVIMRWSGAGRNWSQVLFCQNQTAGPLNPTVAETIFSALKAAAATTTLLGQMANGTSFTGVWVKDVRAGNNPMLRSTSASVPGTGGTNALPLSAAMVITLQTTQAGRGFRGRTYFSGLILGTLASATQLSNTATSAAISWLAQVNTTVSANLGPLGVAQRALNASTTPGAPPPYNQPRAASIIPLQTAVPFANVNARIDSQRRRLGR